MFWGNLKPKIRFLVVSLPMLLFVCNTRTFVKQSFAWSSNLLSEFILYATHSKISSKISLIVCVHGLTNKMNALTPTAATVY